jgi:hypothetical protein
VGRPEWGPAVLAAGVVTSLLASMIWLAGSELLDVDGAEAEPSAFPTEATLALEAPTPSAAGPAAQATAATSPTTPPARYLSTDDIVDVGSVGTEVRATDIATVDGAAYARGFMVSASPYNTWTDVSLGRFDGRLQAVLGFADSGGANVAYAVTLRLDGRVVLHEVVQLGQPHPINIDTAGALRLRVEVAPLSSPGTPRFDWICLCDVELVPG